MENFELQNNQMGVLNQGVNFFKDYVKSGDDLNSNVSKSISDISIEYSKIENNSESSKEKIAKHGIDANVKIAISRNVCAVLLIFSLCVTSIILNKNKED